MISKVNLVSLKIYCFVMFWVFDLPSGNKCKIHVLFCTDCLQPMLPKFYPMAMTFTFIYYKLNEKSYQTLQRTTLSTYFGGEGVGYGWWLVVKNTVHIKTTQSFLVFSLKMCLYVKKPRIHLPDLSHNVYDKFKEPRHSDKRDNSVLDLWKVYSIIIKTHRNIIAS